MTQNTKQILTSLWHLINFELIDSGTPHYSGNFVKASFNKAVLHNGMKEPTNLGSTEKAAGPNGNVCAIGLLIYIKNSVPVNTEIEESWYGYATRILPDLSSEQFNSLFKMKLNSSDTDVVEMLNRLADVINSLEYA